MSFFPNSFSQVLYVLHSFANDTHTHSLSLSLSLFLFSLSLSHILSRSLSLPDSCLLSLSLSFFLFSGSPSILLSPFVSPSCVDGSLSLSLSCSDSHFHSLSLLFYNSPPLYLPSNVDSFLALCLAAFPSTCLPIHPSIYLSSLWLSIALRLAGRTLSHSESD